MSLELANVRFIPSIHQRMAFADEARRVFAEWRPDCVAVELPAPLGEWIVRGVFRLPQLSAVCYPVPGAEGEMHYVPIDPADSMIDALRIALAGEAEPLLGRNDAVGQARALDALYRSADEGSPVTLV